MENTTTWLIGVGGLWVSLSFLLGVAELATLRTIRPPKRQTFTYIRLAATQYQTVFVPAMGALISGLFVSLAASFFYASFTGQQDSWLQLAGIVTFFAGAIALVVTLWSVLKDVGEPVELARDPFSIRAAADESAAAPRRAGLDPDVLEQQLDEWEASISARSMNLSVKGTSDRLAENLTQAAQTRRFWLAAFRSLQVYYAALLRFPFRFGWPLLGFAVFMAGIVWFAIGPAELKVATSWRPWAAVGLLAIVGAIATLFYCVTRGNRARRWHRINLDALKDARKAIGEAKGAHALVAAENVLLQRILTNADKFLQQDHSAPAKADRTVLRFGRFRVSID
ncbi:hypothetical protein [Arthrobacter sp. H14-L1]|uniref:hypothetical protein n=1 Tax=Arthrobacter sp. H14-L1 TaxID=2996697 RepID=UPI00227193C7|nr:hypothetical protein [Arthrobacter sp. H14-L1]MCY0906199.1 hypothetical protein [Arthrobacter sp. H14-L1]